MAAHESTVRSLPAQPPTHCQLYGPACPICAVVDEFVRSYQGSYPGSTISNLMEMVHNVYGGHHV
jgi:hypothetical protein